MTKGKKNYIEFDSNILPSKPYLPGKASKRPSSTVPKKIKGYPEPHLKKVDLDNSEKFPLDKYGKHILPTYCGWCYNYLNILKKLPEYFEGGLCEECSQVWLRMGGKKNAMPQGERNYLRRTDYKSDKRICNDCGKEIGKGKSLCKNCAEERKYIREINRGLNEGSIHSLTEDAGRNVTRVGGGSIKDYNKYDTKIKRFEKGIKDAIELGDGTQANKIHKEMKEYINRFKGKDVKIDIGQELKSYEYEHITGRKSKKDKPKDDDAEYSYEDLDNADS